MHLTFARFAICFLLPLLPVGTSLRAQGEDAQAPPENEGEMVVKDGKTTLNGIEFMVGPCTGHLGAFAEVQVPEGFLFTGTKGTDQFLTLNQNVPNGSEVGTVLSRADGWFVIFDYDETGHIKDDEKNDLDADALLDTLKESNDAGNEVRRKRGWGTIALMGWHKPPFYDPKTNNLTWSVLAMGGGHEIINWSTRLLGRTGTMKVDLVVSPEDVDAAMPGFEALLGGFTYNDGQQYAQFKQGDKLAQYGLTALVAGGAGAVALKTGLLAKFWKLIVGAGKFIILGLAAAFASLKKFLGFGKKSDAGSAES